QASLMAQQDFSRAGIAALWRTVERIGWEIEVEESGAPRQRSSGLAPGAVENDDPFDCLAAADGCCTRGVQELLGAACEQGLSFDETPLCGQAFAKRAFRQADSPVTRGQGAAPNFESLLEQRFGFARPICAGQRKSESTQTASELRMPRGQHFPLTRESFA